MCTQDGRSTRRMTFQVAKVNKALGSVSQMVDNQHRVIFDSDDCGREISFIENKKNGEKMWLRRGNGLYGLDTRVAPPNPLEVPQQRMSGMGEAKWVKGTSLSYVEWSSARIIWLKKAKVKNSMGNRKGSQQRDWCNQRRRAGKP